MSDQETRRQAQAASFDRAAEVYERARPSYPEPAVDWIFEGLPAEPAVLDLGAGTGKLTRALAGRAGQLFAVDPSEQMLRQLRAALPGVRAEIGTAERIPLPDSSLDLVVAAQAWHWVDPVVAEPEVDRVLRPGGRLALIWNVRDDRVPWVARLAEVMEPSSAENYVEDYAATLTSSFGPFERFTTTWQRPFDRASLLDLVASRSHYIVADESERAAILTAVGHFLDTDPELGGATSWSMPYRTEVFRVTTPR